MRGELSKQELEFEIKDKAKMIEFILKYREDHPRPDLNIMQKIFLKEEN